MFGTVRLAFGTILENLREAPKCGWKSSENRQRRVIKSNNLIRGRAYIWNFYDNCSNCRALIGYFLSSKSGQSHEFIIYAMRQRARAGNLTVCYRKKQMDVSFSCVCPVIDNEFRHNIVKVVCGSTRLSPREKLTSIC